MSIIVNEPLEQNPYQYVRDNGSRFYRDEAYDDGDEHENANTCDTCDEPAQWMTFAEPEEDGGDYATYCCQACAEKYGITDLIDKEDV